jgi:hypothetical protein
VCSAIPAAGKSVSVIFRANNARIARALKNSYMYELCILLEIYSWCIRRKLVVVESIHVAGTSSCRSLPVRVMMCDSYVTRQSSSSFAHSSMITVGPEDFLPQINLI